MLKLFNATVEQEREDGADAQGEIMHAEIKYDLIVAVLNQGYSEEFMKAAREAGAGGGTVINARGLSSGGTKKIFGISIQDEKEIIIILSTRKKKTPIMSAVSKSYGVSTKADGLIFSLPVDEITGVELR
jgi:nitrogen regulatory protein PII